MKAKTLVLSGLCFALFVGSSAATVFRVSVEGQPDVLTTTPPVERGSVTLVRRLSDGQLTAIPSELVRAVSAVPKTGVIRTSNAGAGKLTTTLTRAKAATTLAAGKTTLAAGRVAPTVAAGKMINGTTIVLGPTGGTRTSSSSSDGLVVSATRSGMGSAGAPGIPLEAQIFRGDLPRLTPRGTELTLGSPATAATAAATLTPQIGPNGFPVFANVTVPALATVGPNGFLTTTDVSGQQIGVLPIGPNGFPDTTASANTGLTVGIPATQATGSSGSVAGATTVGVAGAPAAGASAAPASGAAAGASPQ